MPFCPVPTYLGAKLDRLLAFHHHLKTLCQNLSICVMLLRRLAGLEWVTGAKTLCTAPLSLVYSTAEYCAPVWCRSEHTCFIDNVFNDALCIVTGCLHPMPMDHLPILLGIQPAELHHLGATLSLTKCVAPWIQPYLHGQLAGLLDVFQERLKSRCPFVHAVQKLLNDQSKLGIRAA